MKNPPARTMNNENGGGLDKGSNNNDNQSDKLSEPDLLKVKEGGVDIYKDKSTGDYWLWNGVKGADADKERLGQPILTQYQFVLEGLMMTL